MPETDSTEAGPELDALVAVEVMGWIPPPCLIPRSREQRWEALPLIPPDSEPQLYRHADTGESIGAFVLLHDSHWKTPQDGWHWNPLRFSTDWTAAGEVLERIQELGWTFLELCKRQSGGWRAEFGRPRQSGLGLVYCTIYQQPTAPLAICLAALAAVRLLRNKETLRDE